MSRERSQAVSAVWVHGGINAEQFVNVGHDVKVRLEVNHCTPIQYFAPVFDNTRCQFRKVDVMTGGVTFRRVAAVSIMLTLAGCAHHYGGDAVTDPYGFFSGIWHGIVFPFALFVNLFSWLISLFGGSFLQSIEIIGRPNIGFFYYLGFVLGLGAWSGSAA